MRGGNNSVDTVNAAASAIISAENRVQQVTVPRKRWGGFLSIYLCFGSQKNTKRMNQATLVPEPTASGANPSNPGNENLSQSLTLPFIVPPSSPASFLNSEPPSSSQSPGGFLSQSAMNTSSIFTVGPYANETQLVSPPVFSTFTTEPNTAPFTPPPESVHVTTPPSPEVPFAQLLSSFESNRKKTEAGEFNSYPWYPGSPIQVPAVAANGLNNRVSFELTAVEVARALQSSFGDGKNCAYAQEIDHHQLLDRIETSSDINGASKDFNFSNSDGAALDTLPPKNWAFFPMVQTGLS